jgi:hypothetical protein
MDTRSRFTDKRVARVEEKQENGKNYLEICACATKLPEGYTDYPLYHATNEIIDEVRRHPSYEIKVVRPCEGDEYARERKCFNALKNRVAELAGVNKPGERKEPFFLDSLLMTKKWAATKVYNALLEA